MISSLTRLTILHLAQANLSGPLPPFLSASNTSLQAVYLDNNAFNGTLPATLPASLQRLWLSYNMLGGVLPTSWSNSSYLRDLVLSHNQLKVRCAYCPWQMQGRCLLLQIVWLAVLVSH